MKNLAAFAMVLVLGALAISMLTFGIGNVFTSPDEASGYQSMTWFAKTGNLYYTEKNAKLDIGNNLHSRSLLTIGNKIVPFNFLGLPVIYGAIYKFVGDNIRYINVIFLLAIIYSQLNILNILTKRNKYNLLLASISILLNGTIIYYLNFPYFNATPALALFSLALLFLIKYRHKPNNDFYLLISVFFAGLSLWFVYYWALFYVYIYGFQFFSEFKIIKLKIPAYLLSLAIVTLVFLAPLFIFDKQLYGNPLTIGYSVFTKVYFYQERSSSIYQSIITYLFPSRILNIQTLLSNIVTSLFQLSPIYFAVAYFGLIMLIKRFRKLIYFIPLVIWFILYNGTSDTYLSGSFEISSAKAIVRYWLPLYFILSTSFSYFLIKQKKIIIVLILFCCLLSLPTTLKELSYRREFLIQYEKINNNYEKYIKHNSYILAPMSDKYLFQIAKPITWWQSYGEVDTFFQPTKLNYLITNLLRKHEFVYAQQSSILNSIKMRLVLRSNLKDIRIVDDLYRIELISGKK
jgi:hypothetical protein